MTRKFIAAVVCTALSVTAIGAAPAKADEDLAKALATIVGIAIVGKVISDKLDDDKPPTQTVARNRAYDNFRFENNANTDRVITPWEPRPLPRRVERRLLPGDCLRSFETSDGRVRVFGKRCLERNYSYNQSLPRSCAVRFRVNNKKRRGYDARCLRREGYQLARR